MVRVGKFPSVDARAKYARASMARVLRRLAFEFHPIVNRPVCAIVHDGDILHFDETEIEAFADQALTGVIRDEISRFQHLPDIRVEHVCRQYLENYAAAHTPERWSS